MSYLKVLPTDENPPLGCRGRHGRYRPPHDSLVLFRPAGRGLRGEGARGPLRRAPCRPSPFLTSNKVAVLVEPREQMNLVPILIHFAGTLADDWGFHVFNSPKTDALLRSSPPLLRMIESGKLVITNVPSDVDMGGGELVSRFLTKPWVP
ncbi:hypothetical protein BDK51DRAFT_41503 [Blyttiomyces helicus]|uniref:Uncharacterized protein n=1 Tax=Blyttiomyces helicus TaxID=388810 RepID=A0A4P9WC04_9FUNG|nr:hypothetical protein BDK51DRAFT_41503 [Blyttiomyces helicus]|eukprot:RKO87856.1 hypothetical protein BDK51DRAFT_41503 [Blyttiomyces helicus]